MVRALAFRQSGKFPPIPPTIDPSSEPHEYAEHVHDQAFAQPAKSASQVPSLFPYVAHNGGLYMAPMLESETGDLDPNDVASSLFRLWAPFMPADWSARREICMTNGVALIPFPLHLVRCLIINCLDESVIIDDELVSANAACLRRLNHDLVPQMRFMILPYFATRLSYTLASLYPSANTLFARAETATWMSHSARAMFESTPRQWAAMFELITPYD